MYANRLLCIVPVLALFACSDGPATLTLPTAPELAAPYAPPNAPSIAELRGTVVASGTDDSPVYLATDAGLVPLIGNQAALMAAVPGVEVSVKGTWDANPGFVVASFIVELVNGRSVVDGILTEIEGRYAVQLANGAHHFLDDDLIELAEHIGDRIWAAAATQTEPFAFGVIAVMN